MDKTRQVFFNSDSRGIVLLSVAVYSLLKHAKNTHPLEIYVACGMGFFEMECDRKILDLAAPFPFAHVTFLDFDPLAKRHAALFASRRNYWSPLLWAFPLCTELLPGDVHGNLVYIDIDMLVRRDLAFLYDQPLAAEGFLAAAVNESRREHRQYLADAGWPESAGYAFNNGMLVIDVDAYRRERIPERIVDWYARHKEIAACVDQDAQNAVFGDRTKRLPLKWNCADTWLERLVKCSPFRREWRVHPRAEALEGILDPAIVHFVGGRKPNRVTHRPGRKEYRAVMREMGLLKGRLPEGQGLIESAEGALFDVYHAFLRTYARVLSWLFPPPPPARATLITGASSGIGEALAEACARRKDTLFLCGRHAERLEAVAGRCRALGSPRVLTRLVDVRDAKAVSEWVADCAAQAPLARVFANAGVSTGAECAENVRRTFETNVGGVLNVVLAALEAFRAPDRPEDCPAQVLVTASVAGYGPLQACPSYSATKACVKTWGLALRGQLAPERIQVNVICPGFIRSRMTDGNTCPMPFFLEAPRAADIILRRADRNVGLIAFPAPMRFACWLLSALPFRLNALVNRLLPPKVI